jgi:HEAT repeat protein
MRLRLILPLLFIAAGLHGQNFIDANVLRVDAREGIAAAITRTAHAEGEWFAWVVPTAEGRSSCCWNRNERTTCTLDGGVSNRKAAGAIAPGPHRLVIMTRPDDGSGDCAVDAEGRTIHLLENVTVEQSLEWLRTALKMRRKTNDAIVAIALHEHPSVVPRLIDLARNDDASEVRRGALFWLGQRAGDKAAGELRRAVDDDPEERVREHAVFAISQLPDDRSVPMLIELANTHKSRAVRKKAMFWLAQKDDPRALEAIEAILK